MYMSDPYISNAEIAVVEKLYEMWKKLEASTDKLKQSRAMALSYTICAAVPKLLIEIKRLRKGRNDKEDLD